jgi:hypothetical protein
MQKKFGLFAARQPPWPDQFSAFGRVLQKSVLDWHRVGKDAGAVTACSAAVTSPCSRIQAGVDVAE